MDFLNASAAAFFILPLLVLFVLNLLPNKIDNKYFLSSLIVLSIILLATSFVQLGRLLTVNLDFVNFSFLWDLDEKAGFFSLDLLSCVMLVCISLSVLCAALSAKDVLKEEKIKSYVNLNLVLLLAMNGIALVNDLFSFYVFLEAASICAFVLVALNKDSAGLEGSFKYFLMSALATAFILIGMIFILVNTGNLSFATIQAAVLANDFQYELLFKLGLCFLLAGLCIKAGITPFHGWVPDTYQSAPAPVSILLGGIITKICGIYALIRIYGILVRGFGFISEIVMIFGLLAILFGAFAAISQNNFKRILAYSSISQLGYILVGVATGSPLGLVGAALHFFNHSVFKGLLFVNSSSLERELGTLDIRNMGGLARQLPVTGISSILAFLSAAGIPPLSGFWSKLLIIIAAWLCGWQFGAAIALLASIVTLAYFLRLQRFVFFGKSKPEFADIKETSVGNKWAAIILAAFTVAFGFIIPVILSYLRAKGLI